MGGFPQLDLQLIVMVMVTYIIAITIHEFMHAWTALQLGDDTAYHLGRVSLNPVVHFDPLGFFMFLLIAVTGFGFAWGRPVPVNTYRLRPLGRFGKHGSMAVVALAGPASNVALALAAAVSLRLGGQALLGAPLAQGLYTFIVLNVALAAFNMIPVPPLDGSRLLAALVPDFWRPLLSNLERYSFGILLLLIFLAPGVITAMVLPVRDLILRMLPAF